LISAADYQALAEGAALFLAGRDRELVKAWRQRMNEAAAAERYEEAARFRDLLRDIDITLERQKVVTQGGDIDAVGFHRHEGILSIALLFIRGGALIGSRNYSFICELDEADALASFLCQYYSGEVALPGELLIPQVLPEGGGLSDFLTERSGRKVRISVPRRGIKLELVSLATKNAATAAAEQLRLASDRTRVLEELQQKLHLASTPRRIECYDISTFQGKQPVGSRVTFLDGEPFTAGYRRYKVRKAGLNDDFAMMREVMERRCQRRDEDPLPDLIIVDGGLGQLAVLRTILSDLEIHGIDIAALAKSRVRAAPRGTDIERSNERVFLPGRKNPVVLRQNSSPLLLLARIRDEAHRFAVSYHQKLRDASTLRSRLEDLPGIGPETSRALLRQFGSIAALKEASLDELVAVKGVTRSIAEAIRALQV
jgi:excinuclease ABC subunit C